MRREPQDGSNEICVRRGTCKARVRFSSSQLRQNAVQTKIEERQMNTRSLILASFATIALGFNAAQAGPCNTTTGHTADKDAGSGPTVGSTAQTKTSSSMAREEKEHPPTTTMNRATGNTAASSQDTQKQMQGEPTAAQQAQGAKPTGPIADKDC
jgi:hypothetical protein